jgi:hypothetical protein
MNVSVLVYLNLIVTADHKATRLLLKVRPTALLPKISFASTPTVRHTTALASLIFKLWAMHQAAISDHLGVAQQASTSKMLRIAMCHL